jgi:hypothetical protein
VPPPNAGGSTSDTIRFSKSEANCPNAENNGPLMADAAGLYCALRDLVAAIQRDDNPADQGLSQNAAEVEAARSLLARHA